MPGGLSEPIGLLLFPAVKMAGYSAFALYLNRLFPESQRNIFYVGLSRMLLGLAFGTALAMLSFPFVFVGGIGFLIYIFGLIPVRILEWYIIIKGFYLAGIDERPSIRKPILLGVLCSFLLDIPALLGVITAAGFWIC